MFDRLSLCRAGMFVSLLSVIACDPNALPGVPKQEPETSFGGNRSQVASTVYPAEMGNPKLPQFSPFTIDHGTIVVGQTPRPTPTPFVPTTKPTVKPAGAGTTTIPIGAAAASPTPTPIPKP